MRNLVRKIATFALALLIPAFMMVGCQEESVQPHAGVPGHVKAPPTKK